MLSGMTNASSTPADREPLTLLRLRSPADVLAAVPYVLGFHPSNSLVVLALGGARSRMRLAVRADLPADAGTAGRVADRVARGNGDGRVGEAILVGYGPGHHVTPAVDAMRAALAERRVAVREALRAEGGRYWSYECADPSCCPPEGVPFDPTSSVVAAIATAAGRVALPDMEALQRSIAPLTGVARAAMRRATLRAEEQIVERLAGGGEVTATRQRLTDEGLRLVRAAIGRCREGGERLTDDEAARLGAALRSLRVRDEAWVRADPEHTDAHRGLWTDVVRRVETAYVPAPACLLAIAN